MNILTIVLKCANPYAAAYKQMRRVELQNPSKMVMMCCVLAYVLCQVTTD